MRNDSSNDTLRIIGQLGRCGDREVFLGFASAGDLCRASFPDVLDEASGRGYQRRFTKEHSLEFKRYIQREGATSIPLTFNLRDPLSKRWTLSRDEPLKGFATLRLDLAAGQAMVQVDGQHRLGFMHDSPIQFAFMTFIGMSEAEEMEVFRTINGKAKGLSSSLLDFTLAKSFGDDLAKMNPSLFVALGLNRELSSPWYGRLDLGGEKTVGTKRIASLRTMHQAVRRLARAAGWSDVFDAPAGLQISIAFWQAVADVLATQWANPRHHMLVKGIGVYALMELAGTLVQEATGRSTDLAYFVGKLSDFADRIDWSNRGPMEGFGGLKGADMAYQMIMQVRKDAFRRLAAHA
jgi:DGQHR domain-containing protein